MTAIYSVIRGVLLCPLPFEWPKELLTLCETHPTLAGFCVASLSTVGTGPTGARRWRRSPRPRLAHALAVRGGGRRARDVPTLRPGEPVESEAAPKKSQLSIDLVPDKLYILVIDSLLCTSDLVPRKRRTN